jgi:hypothetical protein
MRSVAEDWRDLDALVDAELDLALGLRRRPVPEPEVDEALFLDQATAFLRNHADPQRLIAELVQRFPLIPETEEPPASAIPASATEDEPQANESEADDEPA